MWIRHQNGAAASALILKAKGKVGLCLDPTRFNKVLIREVHRGPSLNDIMPRLAGSSYHTLIHASLEYHNLKIDENCY